MEAPAVASEDVSRGARLDVGYGSLPDWLQPIAEAPPVTMTATAARRFALTGGVPDSLAWIVGIVPVFVPPSVWRYRRMS
jgi:hypothetical protein